MIKNIYNLEFKLFLRSRAAWIGIIVLLLTSCAGLYFGKAFIANQQKVIDKAAVLQQKNTQNNIAHFGKDVGLVFYHNKFSVASTPTPWAAFANGQRDINPYLISVTMLALEGQLYDTDITNPVSTLLGNMDLSFIFIFLFPLVIIAFNYNLISEQQESGVWTLLKSQTNSLTSVIWQKFMVRMSTIFAVALLLIFGAIFYLHLPIDWTLAAVVGLIIGYLSFWAATSLFFISLGKSSNYNASALVTVWVLLCIVIPASVNLVLTQQLSVPEALQNVINQREGYHEKWDLPKNTTMDPFFKHYPAFKKYPFPANQSFSWFWYYAMQQMGDDQTLPSRMAMERKLAARQQITDIVAWFIPSLQTQLAVNEIAASDLNSHLEFQQSVRKYHEQIRLNFYPAIFQEKEVSATHIKSIGLQTFTPTQVVAWQRFLSLFATTLLLFGMSAVNLKKPIANLTK